MAKYPFLIIFYFTRTLSRKIEIIVKKIGTSFINGDKYICVISPMVSYIFNEGKKIAWQDRVWKIKYQ
jgi:hypothetical protein